MSAEPEGTPRRAVAAWCLYDWANSAFPTVIVTFVFAAYFTQGIAVDEVTGTAQWGWAMSLSALAVAVAGPVLGAIADHGGRRKPWLALFTVIAVLGAGALWWGRPSADAVVLTLVIVGIANFAFEMGMVFYNAMLPDLVPRHRLGRVSGWGWGVGYVGGLACLGAALVLLVQAETPILGLDKEAAEHLRATGPMVAVWFCVFAVPLFLWTPDRGGGLPLVAAVGAGLATLAATLRNLRRYRDVLWFLVARMVYTDGLATLFAFGGIYAAGTFGMDFEELILLGIAMNVTAGLGAFAFGWIDDRVGPKPTILFSVGCLALLGVALLVVPDRFWFWVFALPLGIFVGPAQSASRSMMARLAPADMRTEFFGLYAFSGKATAFLGPAVLGAVTAAAGSQRWGMATIIVFLVAGMALLAKVPDAR